MTEMYNVVAKLRSGESLADDERGIHRMAACGVLLDLHEELDAAVAEAYGWPWPLHAEEVLQRVVELYDVRKAEEEAGTVRWLRPDFQEAKFGLKEDDLRTLELAITETSPTAESVPLWPSLTVEQIAGIQAVLGEARGTVEEIASAFQRARRDTIQRHLDTLELMGEVAESEGVYELLKPGSVVT